VASPSIRPATESDAPLLARIALIASRAHLGWGFYGVWFGGTDDERLARLERAAKTRARWFHHYSIRLVAEVDGCAAGSIVGFPATVGFYAPFPDAMAETFSVDDMASFAKARPATDTASIAHPEGAWGIELVGVLPEFRGHGVGYALLAHVLEHGRAADYTLASVVLEIGNDAAQRTYERAGLAVVEEKRHPEFERVMRSPGMRRAERSLSSGPSSSHASPSRTSPLGACAPSGRGAW
jgi:ribosomal protein S18 acetylase RimI-like enzyme